MNDAEFNAIINLAYSSRPRASIKYFADTRKVVKTLDGLNEGVAVGTPSELAAALMADHHDPLAHNNTRTFVLSVKTPKNATPGQLARIYAALEKAFFDYKKKMGGIAMLGWIHGNTRTVHLHGIMPNSTGRRTLNLGPKFLSQLQDFDWTTALASGRGKGVRKALSIYPKARSLTVRDLAARLLDGAGNFNGAVWAKLQREGAVVGLRKRKDGTVISFEFDGRRVRLATLRGFQTELKSQKGNAVYDTVNKPQQPGTNRVLPPHRQRQRTLERGPVH